MPSGIQDLILALHSEITTGGVRGHRGCLKLYSALQIARQVP